MTRLQDPLSIGPITLRNRLVMAPMVTAMADDHEVTDAHVAWYRERVRGLGLAIVESTGVAPDGLLVPRLLGIWDDRFVPGLTRLVEAIHGEGVPAVLQIVHGGARSVVPPEGMERVGASTVRIAPGPPPRPLRVDELPGIVEAFAAAARRAVAAGFDGVEIHGAHAYLLSQFLSPVINTRTDGYGGSLEGRARLLLDVVAAVKRELRPEHLLVVRMHGMEAMEGGLSATDAATLAQLLEAAGVHVLDLSGIGSCGSGSDAFGTYLTPSSVKGRGWEPGTYAPSAGQVRKAVGLPVITVGRLAEGSVAQDILDRGDADLIALGRQLITDPTSGLKLLEGRQGEIHSCKECLACFASIRTGPVRCSEWKIESTPAM